MLWYDEIFVIVYRQNALKIFYFFLLSHLIIFHYVDNAMMKKSIAIFDLKNKRWEKINTIKTMQEEEGEKQWRWNERLKMDKKQINNDQYFDGY